MKFCRIKTGDAVRAMRRETERAKPKGVDEAIANQNLGSSRLAIALTGTKFLEHEGRTSKGAAHEAARGTRERGAKEDSAAAAGRIRV